MCCGQKRAALQNTQQRRVARSFPRNTPGNRPAQAVRTQPAAHLAARNTPPPKPASIQPPAAAPTAQPSIALRYLDRSPVRVRGLFSGKSYEFSGSNPVQHVDARDSSSLLHTPFFRRA
jgi:hypothetical protein